MFSCYIKNSSFPGVNDYGALLLFLFLPPVCFLVVNLETLHLSSLYALLSRTEMYAINTGNLMLQVSDANNSHLVLNTPYFH